MTFYFTYTHITLLPPRDDPNEHVYSMSELVISGFFKDFQPEGAEYTKAKKIKIKADKPIDYVIDGENFVDQELTIEKTQPHSISYINLKSSKTCG